MTRTTLVDQDGLRLADESPFVAAIPARVRAQIFDAATTRRAERALGDTFNLRPSADWSPEIDDEIRRLLLAYELTAADGLDAAVSGELSDGAVRTRAAMHRAFELRLALSMPSDPRERALHVLQLAAYGYIGQRWQDARRFLRESKDATKPLPASSIWSDRVLAALFDAWVSLIRKESAQDLARVADSIIQLRREQSAFEQLGPKSDSPAKRGAKALHLVALYNWARATELVGTFMLQGTGEVATQVEAHFGHARRAAQLVNDAALDVLLRHLQACSSGMIRGSVWRLRRVAGIPAQYVSTLPTRGVFELLPPQRVALFEQNLLDPTLHAVIVDLPTSGGKTQLAELRILQALEGMRTAAPEQRGWVAYVAPTRALVDQLTRRLRKNLGANVRVERLSGAIDLDPVEQALLTDVEEPPDVLICTPEKLMMVLRAARTERPLALVVVDEAHNIEDPSRGTHLELLLASVRTDHPDARFLLLMPHVPEAVKLERWLAPEGEGKTINLSTSAWQPNERIIGLIRRSREGDKRPNWHLTFETAVNARKTMMLEGTHRVGAIPPLPLKWSESGSKTKIAAAMAAATASRGTSIILTTQVDYAHSAAESAFSGLADAKPSPEISLVTRFLSAELGGDSEIPRFLSRRVGIHHASMSEESRALMEWLAEERQLSVLAATMTLAQGLNFPVSSVYLQGYGFYDRDSRSTIEMSPLDFWNLAGRAGRIDQGQMGVVGIACDDEESESSARKFLSRQLEKLITSFERILEQFRAGGMALNLQVVQRDEQWREFRSFIAHLVQQKAALDQKDETEQLLRNTLAFRSLQAQAASDPAARKLADDLVAATREYAARLSGVLKGSVGLAEATGFDPENINSALSALRATDVRVSDWTPASLFGEGGNAKLASIIGVAMQLPELRGLNEFAGAGFSKERLAKLATDWVNGVSIADLAKRYFKKLETRDALNEVCKAVYKGLGTFGTWGLAGLGTLAAAGKEISDEQRRELNLLPAFLYYGVSSEDAVVLRMEGLPRSIAPALVQRFRRDQPDEDKRKRPSVARDFLANLTVAEWDSAVGRGGPARGADYRDVWLNLSGQSRKEPRKH